jgi:predicted O-methyltransferase YrrM
MRRLLRALRTRWQQPTLDALAELRRQQAMDYRQLEALASLLAVLQPRAPLPPFRGWAVGPDFASLLVTLVLRERPACVLELGSGVSTLILGYALERTGGKLVSVDHEAEYAERTRVAVGLHGLAEVATILHAPLSRTELPRRGTPAGGSAICRRCTVSSWMGPRGPSASSPGPRP